MKNILIDMPVHSEAMARLTSLPGVSVNTVEPKEEVRDLPRSQIESVHFLFCTFPPRNLEDMRSLEFIQIASAGYGQLVHLGLDRRGIRACNGLGNFDVPIAEWSIAMMVNLTRDLRGMIRNQESGVWDRSAVFQKEIRGSILGIWSDHPLWRFPNVTPHISGSAQSPRFLDRIWGQCHRNTFRTKMSECWLSGQLLLNELSIPQLRGE